MEDGKQMTNTAAALGLSDGTRVSRLMYRLCEQHCGQVINNEQEIGM